MTLPNLPARLVQQWDQFDLRTCIRQMRGSRRMVLFIVFFALLLDNMLMSVIVPILPDFLVSKEHPEVRHPLLHTGNAADPSSQVSQQKISAVSTTLPPFGHYESLSDANLTVNETKLVKHLVNIIKWKVENNSFILPDNFTMETVSDESENDVKKGPLLQEVRLKMGYIFRQENVKVGLLFASKAVVQLLTNPFVGPLTNRVGYSLPMFTGFIIMFASTLVFAIGESYIILLLARMIQGVGSSCSSVAGMGMLAQRYQDDEERGAAVGMALSGLAFGVLIGPPFGGVMYEFLGKSSPFLVLAFLALLNGMLQLTLLNPTWKRETDLEGASLLTLLKDPYILVASGAIVFGNMGIAMLEPSLPLWMLHRMRSSKWQLGAVFLPASFSYLISTNIFGPLGHKFGRWLCSLIGLILVGASMFFIPFAGSVAALFPPNFGLGFGIGMVDATMMPIMGYLVDIRHTSVYGSVYAIADVALCIGFAIGPSLSGALVETFGFSWMLRFVAIVGFIYAPFCLLLRNPPAREENIGILMEEQLPVSYSTEKQTDYRTLGYDPDFSDE